MSQLLDTRRKKDLGAFYTHQGLSDLICAWAITSPGTTVLEPSFGGCGFLRSARDRLVEVGSPTSLNQLFGCDIDPEAFSHLSRVFERPVDLARFHEGDFLDQKFPESWPTQFDAVVGNPPYLPYRKIRTDQREQVLKQLEKFDLILDRRASLWAYFTALGVLHTSNGGRMAWVLPSSFLYANYSSKLRSFIAKYFEDVRAFELKERQFLLEGTEEKTVVLLCKGKLDEPKNTAQTDIPLDQCDGVKDLKIAIARWDEGKAKSKAFCGTSVFDGLSESPRRLVERFQTNQNCKRLGDFLGIKIGLVTGNNSFFLLNESDRIAQNLPENELKKILPRFHFAPGMRFDVADHNEMMESNGKGFLVSVGNSENASDAMLSYLAQYKTADIDGCSTFKKRSVWSKTDDDAPPHAFFPVMQHHGPRLILNESDFNCTNSVHRAYFGEQVSKSQRQLISLSILSTFSQISAEICGRSYGSGALKHEPREAEQIEILLPKLHPNTVRNAFFRVDRMLRCGNLDEARQFVDHLILNAMREDDIPTNSAILLSGLEQIKRHRHR